MNDVGFNNEDYADADVSLTVLADNILADGESATFRIKVPHGVNGNNVRIDNIAIDGAVAVVGNGFASWIADYDLSGSPDADLDYGYDSDGWDNLMEYGLDGNRNGGTTADVTVPTC